MKKVVFLIFIMAMVMTFTSGVFAAEKPEYVVGLGTPSFAWVQYNEADQITGYKGFNLGLGYSSKTYYEPGVKMNEFNKYWGWGTVAVILPYINFGADYAIPVNEASFVTVGGEIGLATVVPYVGLNVSLVF